jgi:type III secretion protein V
MSPTTLPRNAGMGRFNDLFLAGLVVAVIVMMALPLPPWALDVLVAVNISGGIVLLLIALFVPSPLAFSTFPSVLLITTLFRISLNVATTRQILLHAHAGDIIDAFGRLVVGGSLVVGLVVFLIITVVQFIVVAKGAERVAEVGARFTLDALPGKQMSIDSDMRSGLITQSEAVERRQNLMLESQFYGAMDGAMKFVKGDAIAGIVIVLVNLLGGIAIGTMVLDMTFGDAVQRYSVLSIGDGLVTQIPALFVSIAAGIVITRGAPDGSANLGDQVAKQLGGQPRALILSALVMALFAAVPGFPTFTFLILAATVGGLGYMLSRKQSAAAQTNVRLEVPAAAREGERAPVLLQATLPIGRPASAFKLTIGEALVARVTAPGLNQALQRERSALREQYGIPFPGLALQKLDAPDPDGFSVTVQDLLDTALVIPEGKVLVLGPASHEKLAALGTPSEQPVPALLMPCRWVEQAAAAEFQAAGLEVLDAADIIARTVVRVMQKNSAAIMGVQEVRQLLKEIEGRFADLVREAQTILPLPRLADLMAALTRERVPLADLPALLQAIVTEGPGGVADSGALYEAVRMGLARGIVARQMVPDLPTAEDAASPAQSRRLNVIALDAAFEARLRAGMVVGPTGPALALPPPAFEATHKALQAAFDAASARQVTTLLLPADLRRAVSRLLRRVLPRIAFISYEELLASDVQPYVIPVALPAEMASG